MRAPKLFYAAAVIISLLAFGVVADAQIFPAVPTGRPEASADLATEAGVRVFKGEWRYSKIKIIKTEFRAPGADGQPWEVPSNTYDNPPPGGGVDFDDAGGEGAPPADL